MGKYILKRIGRSILSLIAIMIFTIILIYSLMNKDTLVAKQEQYQKTSNNERLMFKYQVWEDYGYIETYDYVNFCAVKYDRGTEDFNRCEDIEQVFESKQKYCEITTSRLGYSDCMAKDRDYLVDSDIPEIKEFIDKYTKAGYTIVRANPVPQDVYDDAYNPGNDENTDNTISETNDGPRPDEVRYMELKAGGEGKLLAYRNRSTFARLWDFFKNIFYFDGQNYYKKINAERINEGLAPIDITPSLTFGKDPHTGTLSLRCVGCKNKYLLYFDGKFPFIHQNWLEFNLGRSYFYQKDTVEVMTDPQGDPYEEDVTYPNGTTQSAHRMNFFSCQLNPNAMESDKILYDGYYTSCMEAKQGKSMIGYSFMIGILSTVISYLLGVPIGILMARHKGKAVDKIGICYIVFMMAVPSLAYIYMFRRLGQDMGLPINLRVTADSPAWTAYILPIVSLALPSIGGLMSWIRRYMIDQMNSDYVKFARAKGLSELEIFNRHIFKNAAIPIIHNIPGGFLGALTGALITERVFGVPGVGKLFTDAIEKTDNSMLVGLTFFYAILSMTALILGDVLMAIVDPRISFSEKGGRK